MNERVTFNKFRQDLLVTTNGVSTPGGTAYSAGLSDPMFLDKEVLANSADLEQSDQSSLFATLSAYFRGITH